MDKVKQKKAVSTQVMSCNFSPCKSCRLWENMKKNFIWVRKLDSNSLTKTKNWSDRNEVIETSGRLHPLWPQNKRLHKPRTTDHRHIRQDIRIQRELTGFHNWKKCHKTESFWNRATTDHREGEQLEDRRNAGVSAVTLGTDGIKGSNPWCLLLLLLLLLLKMWYSQTGHRCQYNTAHV